MQFKDLSITFYVHNIKECTEFYCKYMNGIMTFDCGWYATVKLESLAAPIFISFMIPQSDGYLQYKGGATLNLMVEDVDAVYQEVIKKGVKIDQEIADHDWGDRSFDIKDPIGNTLLIYSLREIKGEFKEALL